MDWSRRDIEIARTMKVSRERVRQMRRGLGQRPSPDHGRTEAYVRLRDWMESHREAIAHQTTPAARAVIPFPVSRDLLVRVARACGIPLTLWQDRGPRLTRQTLAGCVRIDPANGCWLWQGSVGHSGYARIGDEYVARQIFRLFQGEIPKGRLLIRARRNRRCVNPEHLRVAGVNSRV